MWLPDEEHKRRAWLRWGKQLAVLLGVQVALPLLLAATLAMWKWEDFFSTDGRRFCTLLSREEFLNNATASEALNRAYDDALTIGSDVQVWYCTVYVALGLLCVLYAACSAFRLRPLILRIKIDRVAASEIPHVRQELFRVARACRSLELLATLALISTFVFGFGALSAAGVVLAIRASGGLSLGDLTPPCSKLNIQGLVIITCVLAGGVVIYALVVAIMICHPAKRARLFKFFADVRGALAGYSAALLEGGSDGIVARVDAMRTVTLHGHDGKYAALMGTYRRDGFRNGWASFVKDADADADADAGKGDGCPDGARVSRSVDLGSLDVWGTWAVYPHSTADVTPCFVTLELGEAAASPTGLALHGDDFGLRTDSATVENHLSWRQFEPKCPRPFTTSPLLAEWPPAPDLHVVSRDLAPGSGAELDLEDSAERVPLSSLNLEAGEGGTPAAVSLSSTVGAV